VTVLEGAGEIVVDLARQTLRVPFVSSVVTTMPAPSLSRLQQVPIRDIWPTEPQGFTPWLASPENLPLLGEAIGLRLELQSTEESVGDFRADIVCKSIPEGDLVLIENQFAQTDHTHFGQILTYAAGLEAVTIVWIAESFREEHRAAIDWLNEKTPENINFFGLEIELWRIADSPAAPKFNVVCKPNEWTRAVTQSVREPSEQSNLRWSYWSSFVQQPSLAAILSGPLRPNRQGNLPIPTAWRQFKLQVYASNVEGAASIYLSCRGTDRFRNFEKLQANKQEIEKTLNTHLDWQVSEKYGRAWIILNLPELDPRRKDDWPRQQQKLASKVVEFYRALDPYVCPLDQPQVT
jgi:hypothetical protein